MKWKKEKNNKQTNNNNEEKCKVNDIQRETHAAYSLTYVDCTQFSNLN